MNTSKSLLSQFMSSPNNSSLPASLITLKDAAWPRHLCTPRELVEGLRDRTRLRIIKSPLASKIVLQIVGSWAYLTAHVMNKTRIGNHDTFNEEIRRLEKQHAELSSNLMQSSSARTALNQNNCPHRRQTPLLTISNHISCIDDPVLWSALLPLTYYTTNTETVRWSPAAVNICFSKEWHSTFFSLGRTFPILRGVGLNQPAMDFMVALMRCNQWLHMFPEGRVMRDHNHQVISNKERGYIFKWGVAKLILDYFKTFDDVPTSADKSIRLLPLHHLGLDEILPVGWPYMTRWGKQLTIYIRPQVIEMNIKLLRSILSRPSPAGNKSYNDDEIKRIKLTNFLEEESEKLVEPAQKLHDLR